MKQQALRIPVIAVDQPIGAFFVGALDASDLVEISYADVRRLAADERDVERYLGIQRPLSRKRVHDIKKYLQGRDATFPTAVILAVDERCAEYEEARSAAGTGVLTLKEYEGVDDVEDVSIEFDRIAKVLDGQHRIAAFIGDDGEYEPPDDQRCFEINVAIFVGADISEQANIFATVNLAQTKVNKSLVYDLTELAETRSPHKTCHNVAVVLDRERRSPLYRRIKRLGIATPGRDYEPLTQAGFVEALIRFISKDPVQDRNDLLDGERLDRPSEEELAKCPFRGLFIEDKELDIAEIVFNYFCAVKQRWPQSWDAPKGSKNLLPKSNAFKALMKFLREDVYPDIVGRNYGRVPRVEKFVPYFQRVRASDRDFTSRNFAPGSSGQSVFLKLLRGETTIDEMVETE